MSVSPLGIRSRSKFRKNNFSASMPLCLRPAFPLIPDKDPNSSEKFSRNPPLTLPNLRFLGPCDAPVSTQPKNCGR